MTAHPKRELWSASPPPAARQTDHQKMLQSGRLRAIEIEAGAAAELAERLSTGDFVPLVDLLAHQCRWPIGTPRPGHPVCCGRQRRVGSSYCMPHHMRSVRGAA